MVNRLVNVKEEDLGLLLLHEPEEGEVDKASTVDEHEHLDPVVGLGLLNAVLQLSVGGDRVDLVLNVLAHEHFLPRKGFTEKIFSVQIESTSTAMKTTIDTDSMLSSSDDICSNSRAMSFRAIFIMALFII